MFVCLTISFYKSLLSTLKADFVWDRTVSVNVVMNITTKWLYDFFVVCSVFFADNDRLEELYVNSVRIRLCYYLWAVLHQNVRTLWIVELLGTVSYLYITATVSIAVPCITPCLKDPRTISPTFCRCSQTTMSLSLQGVSVIVKILRHVIEFSSELYEQMSLVGTFYSFTVVLSMATIYVSKGHRVGFKLYLYVCRNGSTCITMSQML